MHESTSLQRHDHPATAFNRMLDALPSIGAGAPPSPTRSGWQKDYLENTLCQMATFAGWGSPRAAATIDGSSPAIAKLQSDLTQLMGDLRDQVAHIERERRAERSKEILGTTLIVVGCGLELIPGGQLLGTLVVITGLGIELLGHVW